MRRRTYSTTATPTALAPAAAERAVAEEKAKPTKPNTVDHAGLMQAWEEASLKRGQTIYNNLCVNCHGADGRTPASRSRARSAPAS